MDSRDAAMPGTSSHYMHRVIAGQSTGAQSGLHGAASPGIRLMSNPETIVAVPSSSIGSSAFQVGPPTLVSSHGGGDVGGGVSHGEQVKRKRGRPRKYGPDTTGTVSLALSPISSSGPALSSGTFSGSGAPTPKRRRGRPPGTGRKQQLASLGEWVSGSAGVGFTPHVITTAVGEDIATKIMSFSQQGKRAVCILSANGAVSTTTLRHSVTSVDTVTYKLTKGCFEILCLSGSYVIADDDGSRGRSGALSISLSSPDGRVLAGSVAGSLIAASPVQVIVGSFIYAGSKAKDKTKASHASGIEADHRREDTEDTQNTPPSSLPSQNLPPPPQLMEGGWPGSRQWDASDHVNIDLPRG